MDDKQNEFRLVISSTADFLMFVTRCQSKSLEIHGELQAIALSISIVFDILWHAGLQNFPFTADLPNYVLGLPTIFLIDECQEA